MKKPANLLKQVGVLALLVVLYLGNDYLDNRSSSNESASSSQGSSQTQSPSQSSGGQLSSGANDDTDLIVESYQAKRSDVWVQASGEVAKVLADDNEGSRHQRFLVELRNGHTILIAHNIDLAAKVPLSRGDFVEFRGEYEWNDRGGVVHWTHHDPRGRKEGGWISHRKKTYE